MLVRVLACGVCRTDLHIVDGELTEPKLPLVPGHQIVGEVARGQRALCAGRPGRSPVARLDLRRVPLLPGGTREPLRARALHRLRPRRRLRGARVADERYCFPLPGEQPTPQAAPLLCAGLIGYRALRFCGDAERLGIYGFGGSAHIIARWRVHQGRRVFAITRGDEAARSSPASSAPSGRATRRARPRSSTRRSCSRPVGELVASGLRALAPGGPSSAPAST